MQIRTADAQTNAQKLLYISIQHAMTMSKRLYLLAGQQNGTTGEFENRSTQWGLRMGLCRTRRCTMTARVLQAFTLSLICLLAAPLPLLRAEEAAQEIENSKFQAVGSINANAVYIRSGASENDYPTMKMDRGQQVTVVGIKSDWLKIAPPEGSYCYVAKAYVNKRGDGTMGRVTNPLNVRVGSTLNAMKTKVAAKLDVNDDVKILGEQDEYFKIAPPQSVFLYVNKQFVELVKTVDAKQNPAPAATQAPAPIPTDEQPQPTPPPVAQAPTLAPAPQPEAPTAPP